MRAAGAWLCVLCALAAGCKDTLRGGAARGPVPDYATVAASYNARVAPVDRLWSTSTLRVWYPNKQGEEETAQVEGTLQYLSPWRFLLTFEKVGETYAVLGCNEERYWWIELGENKHARVGEHAKVTPERIARLGVPVHPLDLVEALGITPLPAADGRESVEWSGTSLMVSVPGRMGRRALWLDPATYEPSRVEVLGPDGRPAVAATLEKYERVNMAGGRGSRIATRALVAAPGQDVRVRLTLYDPKVSASLPKPKVFDLDYLLKAYGVKPGQIEWLDGPAERAGG